MALRSTFIFWVWVWLGPGLGLRGAEDWTLVWADEFNTNGPPNPANWTGETGFQRNHERQWYQPENAYCTNGCLIIEARKEHRRNPDFDPSDDDWRRKREWIDCTSAALTTRGLHEFLYGKMEMRARIDTRMGSWPAFWTIGATPGIGWPAGGEVDIMEYYRNRVLANLGWQRGGHLHWLATRKPLFQFHDSGWSSKFHVWTMEWDARAIELRLDGRVMNHLDLKDADGADRGNPFRRPVYLILNQAIGGDSGGDASRLEFPVRYEIDWVRVYQRRRS